jgi:hypothetical protein
MTVFSDLEEVLLGVSERRIHNNEWFAEGTTVMMHGSLRRASSPTAFGHGGYCHVLEASIVVHIRGDSIWQLCHKRGTRIVDQYAGEHVDDALCLHILHNADICTRLMLKG